MRPEILTKLLAATLIICGFVVCCISSAIVRNTIDIPEIFQVFTVL